MVISTILFSLAVAVSYPQDTVTQDFIDSLIIEGIPLFQCCVLDSIPDEAKGATLFTGISDTTGLRYYIPTIDGKCYLFTPHYITLSHLQNPSPVISFYTGDYSRLLDRIKHSKYLIQLKASHNFSGLVVSGGN